MRPSSYLWSVLVCQVALVSYYSYAAHPQCISSPCTNNGVCYFNPRVNDTDCKCPFGFNGKYCQHIDLCAGNKCQNWGTCVPVVTFSSMSYRCDCLPGFTGRNCEKPLSNCANSPCTHGDCIDLGTRYKCDCHPGYEGVHCDKVTRLCSSAPCNQVDSKAKCTDEDVGFSCQCSSHDYFGLKCEASSWKCDKQEESYCLCVVNNVPTKFSIPTPKPYVGADTRDVIAGVTGILLGWVIGTVLFALYQCCCSSGYGWYSGSRSHRKGRGKPWERPSSTSSIGTVSSSRSSTPARLNQVNPVVVSAKGATRNMNIYRTGFVDDMAPQVSSRKSNATYQSGTVDWSN